MKKLSKLRRSVKAISPVISVLLMIAIAVAAALIAYAWVTGYMDFTTTKVGKAIQIQSISPTPAVYVQNIGDSKVTLNDLYINGDRDTTASDDIEVVELAPGETWAITGFDSANLPKFDEKQITVKIVTDDGTMAEYTETFSDASGGSSGTTYSVTITGTSDQGATIPSGTDSYSVGQVVDIEASPYTNYDFDEWEFTGSIVIADIHDETTTATINGAGTITATFTYVPPTPITITLRPEGSGSLTQLGRHGSSSSNWRCVDDTGSGDGSSTYVYDTDQNNYDTDTYNTENPSGSPTGTINSVTVYIRCERSGSDTCHGRAILRIGSTNYYNSQTFNLASSWTTHSTTFNSNPAGGAWSWTAINSLECGVSLESGDTSGGSTSYARCTQVWVEVNYTPS